MRQGFGTDTYSIIGIMNKVLTETVGTEPPTDIEAIAALRNINGVVAATTKAMQSDESRKPFVLAMLVASTEYKNRTGEDMPEHYKPLAARYLLMPEQGFLDNAKEYDFNLHKLKKKAYTNVTVDDIALRLVDEGECAVIKYSHGKFGDRCFASEGWHLGNNVGLRKKEIAVVKATLANSKGHASDDINENITLSGWLAGEDSVILLYRIV